MALHSPLFTIHSNAGAPGSAAGALLKMGSGARSAALADTQTALAEDAFGAAWNPAALGQVRNMQAGLAYNRWLDDVGQQNAAWARPFPALGTFALGLNRLAVGEFQAFDAQGTPNGTIESESLSASLSWGRSLGPSAASSRGLMAGFTLKHLQEAHAGARASSLAADAGLMYRPGDRFVERFGEWSRRATVGAAVRQLGQGLTFDRETAPLPLETAVGVGYSHFLMGDLVTLGLDARRPADDGTFISFGLEYWHKDFLALRGGYRTDSDAGPGLRLGGGVRIRRLQLDYAWTGLGDDLGDTHRVSLLWRWAGHGRDADPAVSRDLYDYYLGRAERHMELKVYDQAVLDFNRALEVRPGDPKALQGLLDAGERMRESP